MKNGGVCWPCWQSCRASAVIVPRGGGGSGARATFGTHQPPQMPAPEDEQVVEALASHRAHPAFGVFIGDSLQLQLTGAVRGAFASSTRSSPLAGRESELLGYTHTWSQGRVFYREAGASEHVLREFVKQYEEARPHQGLGQRMPRHP